MRLFHSLPSRAARLLLVSIVCVGVASLVGCGGDDDEDNTPSGPALPTTTSGYIGSVSAGGTMGTYVAEAIPSGTAVAPTVVGAQQIVDGGSVILEVSVDDTSEMLVVGVSNAEAGGYYVIDLTGGGGPAPAPAHAIAAAKGLTWKRQAQTVPGVLGAVVTYNVTVTAAESNAGAFTLQIGAGTGTTFTELTPHAITVNEVAQVSDDLQVSLNWTQAVDMDLHVQIPDGTVIFFANPNGPNGGQLDLDSNPACFLDNVNNENIAWVNGTPIPGTYKVMVDLWSACDLSGPFPYVVTVKIAGDVSVYEGTLTLEDANAFEPTLVTEFTLTPPAG